MHRWGDENVDWKGIEDSAAYIGNFCRRWGRIGVTQTKEKWGTCRVYVSFGLGCTSLLSITHPGHVSYIGRYPTWLMKLDFRVFSPLIQWSRINKLIVPYQIMIYQLAYKRALKRWSHLREEILGGCDYYKLLGGL